jgi:cytoskeleton-associated protein 5
LKPVQQKELTESFGSEEKPEQTRYTRAQQRERALKEAEASLTANDAANKDTVGTDPSSMQEEEDEPVDAFDFAEPQAILNKLPSGFYENLASAKWKDRKELALNPLLNVLKLAPKIQDANYDELVRALAGRMTDANIACVISAVGCIECLAKGLRTDFAKYKSTALPPILERCKEKKQSVTDALAAALDAIFASVRDFLLTGYVCYAEKPYRRSRYQTSWRTFQHLQSIRIHK